MKHSTRRSFLVVTLACAAFVVGCSPAEPDPPVLTGTTSGGTVVAVGNSLTAGFINGGLVIGGQVAGYANLVSEQIAHESISMPLVANPGIGSESGFGPLRVDAQGAIGRDPLTVNPADLLLAGSQPTAYANLGVPGALTVDLLTRTGVLAPPGSPLPPNPFFDIVLRNAPLAAAGVGPGDQTPLDQLDFATDAGVSTLLLWIGYNDVLGGATGGNPQVGVNITPPLVSQAGAQSFEALFGAVVARVAAMNVPQVAVGNIPPVTSAPYFTAVPLVESTSGAPWATDETDVQFILLPAQAILSPDYIAGVGTSSLPSNLTLTTDEVATLEGVVAAFNGVIAQAAAAQGWALVDVNAELAALPANPQNPATFAQLNAVFPLVPGLGQNQLSAFSLDGIHPSERGYARVANVFLAAINDTYGTSYPQVNEASVQNVVGFEAFAGKRAQGFDASGVAGLRALSAMLGDR